MELKKDKNGKLRFECDVCGQRSSSQQKIWNCERTHIQDKCEHQLKIVSLYLDQDEYALEICVVCKDCGKTIKETTYNEQQILDHFSEATEIK